MVPINVRFKSGAELTVYANDPVAFANTFGDTLPPELSEVSYLPTATHTTKKLKEVKLTLLGGATILCDIAEEDVRRADFIDEIADCDETNLITYAQMANDENELDVRFHSVSQVITNLSDSTTKMHLQKEYLKRKAAYVSALEALVDGVFRRTE
jgi:hypothetical protein